jgi:hypothetical protein
MSPQAAVRALRVGCLVAAAVVSAAMVARSRPGGDQLNLLARGWLLAERGELVAAGNPLSSGGRGPGAATSVLVGLPLELWRDHRAPVALIWLLHAIGFVLLDRTLRPALTPVERAAFAVVWAVGPWRLEASAFLWNPNYLFPIGALHLASAAALRERARFGATLAHVLALGIGAQLHPSVLLLGVLSLLLVVRRFVRLSLAGVAVGAAATLGSLLPWLARWHEEPALLAAGEGFLLRGLVHVTPWLKGMMLWFRYPSLLVSRQSLRLDFSEALGRAVDAWLAPVAIGLALALGLVTLAAVVWADARWLRALRPGWRERWSGGSLRAWLSGYAAHALAAAALVFALTPTTPQAWQGWAIFHAAAIPVALGAGALAARLGERRAVAALAAAAVAALALDVALAYGAPNFRCGGRDANVFPLRGWSPMFEELGLQRDCPWPLESGATWWPDVLPIESRPIPGAPPSGQ